MNFLRLGSRATATAIAIAGLIDPAWTGSRPPAEKLVVIRAAEAPSADSEQALRAALVGWEIEPREAGSRLPCGPGERCVVIADGSHDVSVPDDLTQPISLVTVAADGASNVLLRSVSISRGHHGAAGVARVELSRTGPVAKSEVRILDGNSVIGSATHEWSGASSAAIDVPWWPIERGARALRVEVLPIDGEQTIIDNHVDVGVNVAAGRASVLVFDPRPSWSSTFIRRALEDDARFTVGHRARLAPALSAGTANARLDSAALDLASVVVIGAPDGLTADDVGLLEQFVNVRGGTLILLAERAPSGPWARLAAGNWSEHFTATPEPVGPLRAAEVLRAERLPITAGAIARSGSAAAIAVLPSGEGRIIISGAMDAWRYRDVDSARFDRFWQSLIAEAAALGEGVTLTFDRSLGERGSRSRFTIHDRRMTPAPASEASAVARCSDVAATAIRLWPAGSIGAFTGELPLTANGSCGIEARINDRQVVGALAVTDQPMLGVEQTLTKLERRAIESGGAVARAGDEATLARALAAQGLSPVVATSIHPMRAWWWMLPFAGCVSIEWWLRRRHGLR